MGMKRHIAGKLMSVGYLECMSALASDLRNKLEKVVVDTKDQASLEALAVHHCEP